MKSILRITVALAAVAVGAFCADNTLGTWKLIPEKSKPPAGQSRITSLTVVREASGDGVKVTAKGEREDKSKIDTSYTAKYDGKEVTLSGSGLPYDTIAVKQVDANTLTDVRSKKWWSVQGYWPLGCLQWRQDLDLDHERHRRRWQAIWRNVGLRETVMTLRDGPRRSAGQDIITRRVICPLLLPIGPPAGKEGVVRRWLHIAVHVDRPRADLMLAGAGVPQSNVQNTHA